MGKLYKNVSRFVVRRNISRSLEKKLKWGLGLGQGDIVNSCTMFNKAIKEISPCYIKTARGWYIHNFEIHFFDNSFCSFINCGVAPSISREKVEARWLSWADKYINAGSMAIWYSGDSEGYNQELEQLNKKISILKSGGHITYDNGILMEKYK